jgi:putative hydrolase of the HAD superfamily
MTRAVLFDLFNTLVPGTVGVPEPLGPELGVDAAAFDAAFAAAARERFVGALGDLGETLRTIARRVGGDPSDAQVARAHDLRLATVRATLAAVPAATLETLAALRASGWRIGLVSNVTPGSAESWRASALPPYFDAVAFSDEVRVAKPDAGIYLAACGPLGVAPHECVYVGDGADDELEGATALGMRAVRTVEHATVDRGWTGPTIDVLPDLVALLGPPSSSSGGSAGWLRVHSRSR